MSVRSNAPPPHPEDDRALRLCSLLAMLLAVPLVACVGRQPASGPRDAGPPQLVHVVSDGWHSSLVLERAQVLSAVEPPAFVGSRYVEVGWGDRAAYTAPRMTSRLGLHAAFLSTSSALHVAAFSEPVLERFVGLDVVLLPLDPPAFDELSQFIARSFARDGSGHAIRLGPGHSSESGFYSATGRYHLFNTCNTWVARALRAAGHPIIPGLAHTASQLMGQVRTLGVLLQSRARDGPEAFWGGRARRRRAASATAAAVPRRRPLRPGPGLHQDLPRPRRPRRPVLVVERLTMKKKSRDRSAVAPGARSEKGLSRARGPILPTLVGLILAPLLSGCAYLQYVGLFPTGGSIEDSPTGKTVVAGVMVDEQGRPLSGIVMLEQGKLFRGNFRRGGIVDSGGHFAVEVPDGGQWGLHGYADGYIYHPESITVVPGKINQYRWVLPVDTDPQDNPSIRNIMLTPDPAPGVTVTITLDAFDPRLRLSEQVLGLNARTGDAFAMEPPERPRWGRPLEGKLYPNGTYRATYGPLPPGSDVNDWVFVLANEDCSISRITRTPFHRVGRAGTPATRGGGAEGPALSRRGLPQGAVSAASTVNPAHHAAHPRV